MSLLAVCAIVQSIPSDRAMEQCACVERELEKVLHRFMTYGHQSEERLDELLRSVCELRSQLVAFGERPEQSGQHTLAGHFNRNTVCC